MAIVKDAGGTVITGPHIEIFRLLSLKGALKLESHGIKQGRGLNVRKVVAALLNMKPRAPYPDLLAALEQHIAREKLAADTIEATMQPGAVPRARA